MLLLSRKRANGARPAAVPKAALLDVLCILGLAGALAARPKCAPWSKLGLRAQSPFAISVSKVATLRAVSGPCASGGESGSTSKTRNSPQQWNLLCETALNLGTGLNKRGRKVIDDEGFAYEAPRAVGVVLIEVKEGEVELIHPVWGANLCGEDECKGKRIRVACIEKVGAQIREKGGERLVRRGQLKVDRRCHKGLIAACIVA